MELLKFERVPGGLLGVEFTHALPNGGSVTIHTRIQSEIGNWSMLDMQAEVLDLAILELQTLQAGIRKMASKA